MLYKTALALICSGLLLTACQTTQEESKSTQFSRASGAAVVQTASSEQERNTSQDNKTLIMDFCQMSTQQCSCLADQLSSQLTQEQWLLLRLAIYQEDQPGVDTSDAKLEALNEAMIQAAKACQ